MKKVFIVALVVAALSSTAAFAFATIVNHVRPGCTAGVAFDLGAREAVCADEAQWVDPQMYGPYFKY